MQWKRIFKRKRWYFNIPTILWWFIWELTKDYIMEATRDFFARQGIGVNILAFLLHNPIIIVGIVLAGVFIWAYLDTKKERGVQTMTDQDEKQQPYIHVESHAQQGGITAYQVNIQPGDRQLSTGAAQQLKDYLNGVNFKSVEVNAVMGDGEAFRFASQIKNFLTSEGFDVQGVNQVMYSAPVQGQIIESPNDAGVVKIIIGNR